MSCTMRGLLGMARRGQGQIQPVASDTSACAPVAKAAWRTSSLNASRFSGRVVSAAASRARARIRRGAGAPVSARTAFLHRASRGAPAAARDSSNARSRSARSAGSSSVRPLELAGHRRRRGLYLPASCRCEGVPARPRASRHGAASFRASSTACAISESGRFQGSLCREKPRAHHARRHTASPIDQVHGVGPPALPVETLAKLRRPDRQSAPVLRLAALPIALLSNASARASCASWIHAVASAASRWHRRRALVVVRRTVRGLFPRALGFEHAAAAGTRSCQCGPDRRAGGVPPSLESSRLRVAVSGTPVRDGHVLRPAPLARGRARRQGLLEPDASCRHGPVVARAPSSCDEGVDGLGAAVDNHCPGQLFGRDRRQHSPRRPEGSPPGRRSGRSASARSPIRSRGGGADNLDAASASHRTRLAHHEQRVIAQPAEPRLRPVLEVNQRPKQVRRNRHDAPAASLPRQHSPRRAPPGARLGAHVPHDRPGACRSIEAIDEPRHEWPFDQPNSQAMALRRQRAGDVSPDSRPRQARLAAKPHPG